MNAVAYAFVDEMDGYLARLPGSAASVAYFGQATRWLYVHCGDEASVHLVASHFGLGEPEERRGDDGRTWLRAIGESPRGAVRVEVTGPQRPPASDPGGTVGASRRSQP